MAKIKKYWIRYNAGADRLETTVTEARFRPQGGFDWKEVDIDMCCLIPEVPEVFTEFQTITFTYLTPDVIEHRVHLIGEQGQGYFTTGILVDTNTTEELTIPATGTYTVVLEVVTGAGGYTIAISNAGIAGFNDAAAAASYTSYSQDLTAVTAMNTQTPGA